MSLTVSNGPAHPQVVTLRAAPYHFWALKTRLRHNEARLWAAMDAEDAEEAIFTHGNNLGVEAHISPQQWEDLRLLKEAMGEYAGLPQAEQEAIRVQHRAWINA